VRKNKWRYGSYAFFPNAILATDRCKHQWPVAQISKNGVQSIPIWIFSEKKCRFAFQATKEVPVWHTNSYCPTSSLDCYKHDLSAGFIANWKDKIQRLFKNFQGPKIAVFTYNTIQYNTIQWKICTQKLTNTLSV